MAPRDVIVSQKGRRGCPGSGPRQAEEMSERRPSQLTCDGIQFCRPRLVLIVSPLCTVKNTPPVSLVIGVISPGQRRRRPSLEPCRSLAVGPRQGRMSQPPVQLDPAVVLEKAGYKRLTSGQARQRSESVLLSIPSGWRCRRLRRL